MCFEFCGTHFKVLKEWYGYLENIVKWFKKLERVK
jgi:hypothetical protein